MAAPVRFTLRPISGTVAQLSRKSPAGAEKHIGHVRRRDRRGEVGPVNPKMELCLHGRRSLSVTAAIPTRARGRQPANGLTSSYQHDTQYRTIPTFVVSEGALWHVRCRHSRETPDRRFPGLPLGAPWSIRLLMRRQLADLSHSGARLRFVRKCYARSPGSVTMLRPDAASSHPAIHRSISRR